MEELELSLFVTAMFPYVESHRESTNKLLELMKTATFQDKSTIKKKTQLYFYKLTTNNEKQKSKILFTIA